MSMLFDVWLIMHSMTTLLDEALAPTPLSGDDFGLYSLLRGQRSGDTDADQPLDGDATDDGVGGVEAPPGTPPRGVDSQP